MNEVIKQEVIKKTQESLGKYVKRPPLTDKLLKKPPFRFLHDIVSCIIRETGFMNEVFTPEELNHENVKDKESKIAFLQKLIGAVNAVSDSKVTARPSKIVAGHEPSKTNELLQAIAKALDKKADPKRKILNNNETAQPTALHDRKIKESKGATQRKSSSQTVEPKLSKGSGNRKVGERPTVENTDAKHKKEKAHTVKQRKEDVKTDAPETQQHENPVVLHNDHHRNDAKQPEQSPKFEPQSTVAETYVKTEKKQQVQPSELAVTTTNVKKSARQPSLKPGKERANSTENEDKTKQEIELAEPVSKSQDRKSHTTEPDTQVLGSKNATSTDVSPSGSNDGEGAVLLPKANTPRQKTARVVSARPVSARPAAPRVRDRGEVAVPEEAQPVIGKVNIIAENDQTTQQDENENYLVESHDQQTVEKVSSPVPVAAPPSDLTHGRLVSQILETQKELEDKRPLSADGSGTRTKRVDIEWEDGIRRERNATVKEVDWLRTSIQTLTRAANPLGKWMDFLQEDVDTIQQEMEMWKATNKKLKLQLIQEQSWTNQLIEPLQRQLQHLEKSTEDHHQLLSALRSKIIENDAHIQNLLTAG